MSATPISPRAKALLRASVVWDAHACLPLKPNQSMDTLARHRAAGVNYVSINVGMDFNPLSQVMRAMAGFRNWLVVHADQFLLAHTIDDIKRAKAEGKLAVGFDLEGSAMLLDDLAMLSLYRDLGVNQIHLAYNRDNSVAGGCYGADVGLTPFGRQVVAEINRLGVIMDCSHSGYRTSMEIMELSTRPVVFSHSNVRALREHPRNIRREQIDACAQTGGVIGLSGIGIFVGANDITTASLMLHVDHIAQRVGPRHVGLGLDYVYDRSADEKPAGFKPEEWRPSADFPVPYDSIPPERFPEIAEALAARGYNDGDIRGILGENFLRIAEATWLPAASR